MTKDQSRLDATPQAASCDSFLVIGAWLFVIPLGPVHFA